MNTVYIEKSERELVSVTRCVEVMREELEVMLPTEIIQELRKRVKRVWVDRYMDLMVTSFIKFHVDLFDRTHLTYYAWTLYEKNWVTVNELSYSLVVMGGKMRVKGEGALEKRDGERGRAQVWGVRGGGQGQRVVHGQESQGNIWRVTVQEVGV